MARYIEPKPGTATERRRLRQAVRHRLGVSSQPAPEPRRLFEMLVVLDRLVHLTTGYRLVLARPDGELIEARRAPTEFGETYDR